MASRKSLSNAPLAPKGKRRLAAFAAYVESLADGQTPLSDRTLAQALSKPGVMRCSSAWRTFAQQIAQGSDLHAGARVLPPWQALPPLP